MTIKDKAMNEFLEYIENTYFIPEMLDYEKIKRQKRRKNYKKFDKNKRLRRKRDLRRKRINFYEEGIYDEES